MTDAMERVWTRRSPPGVWIGPDTAAMLGRGVIAAGLCLLSTASRAERPAWPQVEFAGPDSHVAYVECWPAAAHSLRDATIVLIHGASHTGVVFTATPDGRPGWAPWFAAQGFRTCVVDLPGHGRAPPVADFPRMPIAAAAAGLLEVIDRHGPVVLVGHSMGARHIQETLAAADARQRAAVRAAVLLAPVGPTELLTAPLPGFPLPEGTPFRFDADLEYRLFAMAGDAPAPQFPQQAFGQYQRSLVPESPRSLNEIVVPGLAPQHGRALFEGIPTLVVGAEGDNAVPAARLAAAAEFWGVELAMLGRDWGLAGNGHLFPIELNNLEIAGRVAAWIGAKAPPPATDQRVEVAASPRHPDRRPETG